MALIRAWLCCWVAWFALLRPARADELPRVVVLTDPAPVSMLSEALVRVRGELAAAGLSAELRERKPSDPSEYKPDPGVYGVLAFEQLGPVVLIRAFGPATRTPITESVDTQSSTVNAEVLAVRAVETLRAAMVQGASRDATDVPDAVRNFTRSAQGQPNADGASQPPPAKPKPEPPRALQPEPAPHPRKPAPALTHFLVGWIGGGVALEPNARARSSGELGVLAGPRWGFAAASFESSLARLEFSNTAGSASATSRALTLALGARLRLTRRVELFTRAAGGHAWYDVQGRGNPGYVGQHLRPRSAFAALGVSGGYWFADSLGLALDLGARFALDAPRVRIADSDLVALDRPSFRVGLALLGGVL